MKIINVKKEKCEVWGARCGKYPKFKHLLNTSFPENGWLGNPYVIGVDGTREEVIAKYGKDFDEKIEKDEIFREAVMTLKGKSVGCFCSPKLCHLDIVKDYVDSH